MTERLEYECEELATMEFDDVGTEDEWLIIQNEALNKEEKRRQARSKALANIRRRRVLPDNMPDSVTMIRQIRSANE